MAERPWLWPRPPLRWWVRHGALGGAVAGVASGVLTLLGGGGGAMAVTALVAATTGFAAFGALMSSDEMSPSTAAVVGAGLLHGLALWGLYVYVASGPWTALPAGGREIALALTAALVIGAAVAGYLDILLERRLQADLENERVLTAGPRSP